MTRPSPGIAPDGIADAEGFSLVRNDLLFRLQRGLGLIPATGLGDTFRHASAGSRLSVGRDRRAGRRLDGLGDGGSESR